MTVKACYRCGKEIHFDPSIKSKNGKSIPLSGRTGTRKHDCPANPFNKKQTRRPRRQTTSKRMGQEQERVNELLQEMLRRQRFKGLTSELTLLGLPQSCTDVNEVKKAYRKLAKVYHPDRSRDPATTNKFIRIREAYEKCVKMFEK